MGGVDLDHLKAGLGGTDSGIGKGLHDAVNTAVVKFLRLDIITGKRNGTRRPNIGPAPLFRQDSGVPFPWSVGAGFAACVRKLHAGNGPLGFDKSHDWCKRLGVFVVPNSEILRRDAAFRHDRRRFREDQTRSANRPAAEMDKVPLVRQAVVARILAHWGNRNAVGKCDAAQRQWVKKGHR